MKKGFKPNRNGYILWVTASMPRYSYFMYSAPVGPQILYYIEDQIKFGHSLLNEVHQLLNIRLKLDLGWSEKKRLIDEFHNIRITNINQPILKQLNESRLVICTYNATTILETFSINVPTIIFWNPKYWELRPSAEKYYNNLREVGILHETPESAAIMVNEIYKDPISWWEKPEVQNAKNEFCYNFARNSDNWVKEWKKEFNRIN